LTLLRGGGDFLRMQLARGMNGGLPETGGAWLFDLFAGNNIQSSGLEAPTASQRL